jgi:hypothetical protein
MPAPPSSLPLKFPEDATAAIDALGVMPAVLSAVSRGDENAAGFGEAETDVDEQQDANDALMHDGATPGSLARALGKTHLPALRALSTDSLGEEPGLCASAVSNICQTNAAGRVDLGPMRTGADSFERLY